MSRRGDTFSWEFVSLFTWQLSTWLLGFAPPGRLGALPSNLKTSRFAGTTCDETTDCVPSRIEVVLEIHVCRVESIRLRVEGSWTSIVLQEFRVDVHSHQIVDGVGVLDFCQSSNRLTTARFVFSFRRVKVTSQCFHHSGDVGAIRLWLVFGRHGSHSDLVENILIVINTLKVIQTCRQLINPQPPFFSFRAVAPNTMLIKKPTGLLSEHFVDC